MLQLLFAMDFKPSFPDVLQWMFLAIMGVIQIRGIQAFYQDFTSHRARPQRQPEPPEPPAVPESPMEPPVPPPAPPPEPPVVVRHYIRHQCFPEKVWASKTGTSYHLREDCQYVRQKAKVTSLDLCLVCQQKANQ